MGLWGFVVNNEHDKHLHNKHNILIFVRNKCHPLGMQRVISVQLFKSNGANLHATCNYLVGRFKDHRDNFTIEPCNQARR